MPAPTTSPDASPAEPRRPARAAPLAPVAIGLMLGIAVDSAIGIKVTIALAAFIVAGLLILIRTSTKPLENSLWHRPMAGANRLLAGSTSFKILSKYRAALGLLLASAAVGVLRHDLAMNRWPADHLAQYVKADEFRLIRLAGEIVSPVQFDSDEVAANRGPFPTEPRTRFLLDADSVDSATGPIAVSGRVLVSIAAPALHVAPGRRVEILGRIFGLRGPDNPGQYDWSLRRKRDGILLGLTSSNERSVRVLDRAHGFWPRAFAALRRPLRRLLIDDTAAVDETSASLLDAMVLAQRGQVERSLDDAFFRTGTIHFLCASGMNVAWLAAVVWGVFFACGAHYRTTALASIAAIIGYALVADPNPPILRAVVTGGLFFIAQWLRRPRHAINWLAAAVIILLLIHPTDLFDAGFQFSFAIAAGLVLFAPPLTSRFMRPSEVIVGGVALPLDRPPMSPHRRRLMHWLLFPLLTSLIAWLIGVPIAAAQFGRFNPWGWFNSLLMAPLAFLVMLLGFAKLLLAAVLPSLAGLFNTPLGWTTSALAWLAKALAAIPGCSLNVPPPTPLWLVAYYAVFIVLICQLGSRRARLPAWLAVLPIAVGLFIPWRASPRRADELRVWTLAVGDGAATIIELPNGRTLACDLGTRGFFDPTAHVILPFLQTRGIKRLDAVIVSHPDYDHYAAVADVARAIPVGRVYLNPHFERFAPADSAARLFLDKLAALHLPLDSLRAGDTLPDTGDVRIECLWPTGDPSETVMLRQDNDTSTVLRITWQGRSILLPGDIADAAESALLQRGNLKADVLSLPHHGSTSATALPRFVAAVDPPIVLRSTGRRDADTSERLWSALGDRAYHSTAECGAVCAVVRSGSVRIETFRSSNGKPRTK